MSDPSAPSSPLSPHRALWCNFAPRRMSRQGGWLAAWNMSCRRRPCSTPWTPCWRLSRVLAERGAGPPEVEEAGGQGAAR
jgi:hypothetical protein